jgi:hypothetical protein
MLLVCGSKEWFVGPGVPVLPQDIKIQFPQVNDVVGEKQLQMQKVQ